MQTPGDPYGTTGTPASAAMPKRDSAAKIGGIFGVILFLTSLIIGFIFRELGAVGAGGITNFFAQITILMIAGAIAARRFASGALSGLTASLVSSVLGILAGLAGLRAAANVLQGQTNVSAEAAATVLGVAAILALTLAALLGKLFGMGRDATTYRT